MTLTSGRLLAQRYRLGRRIAVGGMGEVWEAQDSRLERPVAVKVLKPELSGDAEFRHRFHIEARITASLNHPGIAAVHDYGETAVGGADPDVSYLVMELVAGDPLAAILMRHPRLGTHRTLDILGQAAEALQAAHERGLVHRDVKPGNILITPTGTVKLTDFGIARAVDAAPVTRQGMVLGTAHYVAPEQAAGHDAGTASDVYSLAVVGYECLAGQRPFVADSAVTVAMMHIRDRPSPLPPDVPAGVRALIETALVKDPRQRYGTGGEFAAAVAAVRAGHRPPPPLGSAATRTDHPGVTTAMTGGMTARHLPPTALLSPAAGLDPSRRLQRRGVSRITLGLLGALAVGLAGYLIDEALRVDATSPEAGAADAVPAPDPPAVRRPAPPIPTERQPADPAEKLLGVFVNPTAYLGARGSDAAITAKSSGLVPEVVDEDGGQVDRDRRSQCRVVEVEPELRFVAPGSTLELTCRRFR